jgi:hypothetical protein
MSIAEIQRELRAPKGNFNSFGKYRYRSCEDIIEAVKPLLAQYKWHLNLTDEMVCVGDRVYVKSTATVKDGDAVIESATAFAREAVDQKGKDDSQITGTASSYARKYALNGLFAIDDTKDADTDEHRKIPAPTEAYKRAFESVTSLDGLKSLWEGLTKEEREICAELKETAKGSLK